MKDHKVYPSLLSWRFASEYKAFIELEYFINGKILQVFENEFTRKLDEKKQITECSTRTRKDYEFISLLND